jgi:hypothetical protein
LAALTTAAALIATYAFIGPGAGSLIEMILKQEDIHSTGELRNDEVTEPSREARMGRKIGILERYLILTLILINQWEAIGLILAAKSLARFKELEDRRFSEYYLIGTLLSVLLALATGLLIQVLI